MTRFLSTIALLALLTSQLSAQISTIQPANRHVAAQQQGATAQADSTSKVEASPVRIFNRQDTPNAPGEEELPESSLAVATDGTQGFHSVCDGGCRIPPLWDCWCNCDTDCGTTDCWIENPCECAQGNCYLTEDGTWVSNDAWCDAWGGPVYPSNAAVRFGWWGVSSDGSPTKVGEYQSLEPSPFWDIDGISSDGVRTWNFSLSGLDNEANSARVRFYGPELSARVDYERYLRRLDHEPLTGFNLLGPDPPTLDDKVVDEDLNVGQDYAIRVEELDARFKGNLTDNLKWKLNLWGMRKFGHRQTNAVAHCYDIDPSAGTTNNKCHLVSQSQSIDWLTMEIEPVLEAEFEYVTVEYSRTMRSFNQNDGFSFRQYTHFSGFTPANNELGPDYAYSLVPDNYTQIDRLKIGATLNEYNRFYGNLFLGDTKNEFRSTHRRSNGFDLRIMNNAYETLNLTGYASRYDEDNQLPSTFLTEPPYAPDNTYDEDSLRHPVDYTRTRAGLKGRWRPFANAQGHNCSYGFLFGSSLAAGYEYYQLQREFAVFDTTPQPPGPFSQPNTVTHMIEFGPSTRWSETLETYTRYRGRFIRVPLIGVTEYSDDDPDVEGTFNTSLPEQVHGVEIGGTWTPASNFLVTAQFTVENSWNRSTYANFTENNYPIVCTIWYAPTPRWSLTAGYAYYTNWIDQDITLGAYRGEPDESETTRWNYAGKNQLVSLNANYAWTDNVQLVGGYEWNRGDDSFVVPPSIAGADWSLLPSLSDVLAETQRVTAGVDWQPNGNMNVYFRYVLFDYDDLSSGLDTGIAHMFLGGAGINW